MKRTGNKTRSKNNINEESHENYSKDNETFNTIFASDFSSKTVSVSKIVPHSSEKKQLSLDRKQLNRSPNEETLIKINSTKGLKFSPLLPDKNIDDKSEVSSIWKSVALSGSVALTENMFGHNQSGLLARRRYKTFGMLT